MKLTEITKDIRANAERALRNAEMFRSDRDFALGQAAMLADVINDLGCSIEDDDELERFRRDTLYYALRDTAAEWA